MVFDVPRRYFRNLRGCIVAKPPCVIFTLCLACLAVALFCLGYYVNNHEVVDPEAEQDWNDFLTGLSNNQFCIDQDTEIGSGIGMTSLSNETQHRTGKYLSSSQNDVQHISIPLKIGITVTNKLHHLHGNITHLTTVLDSPMIADGNIKSNKVNLTFSLSEIWTTEKKCDGKGKCKLPQGFFHSCVTIAAPHEILPEWKPATCNLSSVVSMTTMRPLSRKEQRSKTSCKSGAIIYFKHPVDLELREKLSVDERAKANLHLQLTSYFLFILVITSIIYGMLKGKPVKLNKVTFESVGSH